MTFSDWSIEPFDVVRCSDEEFAALHALYRIVDLEERPELPPSELEELKLELRNQPATRQWRDWVVWDRTTGRVLGHSRLSWRTVPENRHLAWFRVEVQPDQRRNHLGTALLQPVLDTARAEERSLLGGEAVKESGGEAFLDRLGAEQRMLSRESWLRIDDVDRSMLEGWVERAPERAAEYELRRWDGRCPDDILLPFAELTGVMNTAPRDGLDEEDWVPTPNKLVDNERTLVDQKTDWWTACAVHSATGELAGFTQLYFTPFRPTIGFQGDTGVDPKHRDKGLGRWLKAALMLRVLDERPELKTVMTWNAGSNAAMLGINDAMGFRPALWWSERQVPVDVLAEAVKKRVG